MQNAPNVGVVSPLAQDRNQSSPGINATTLVQINLLGLGEATEETAVATLTRTSNLSRTSSMKTEPQKKDKSLPRAAATLTRSCEITRDLPRFCESTSSSAEKPYENTPIGNRKDYYHHGDHPYDTPTNHMMAGNKICGFFSSSPKIMDKKLPLKSTNRPFKTCQSDFAPKEIGPNPVRLQSSARTCKI